MDPQTLAEFQNRELKTYDDVMAFIVDLKSADASQLKSMEDVFSMLQSGVPNLLDPDIIELQEKVLEVIPEIIKTSKQAYVLVQAMLTESGAYQATMKIVELDILDNRDAMNLLKYHQMLDMTSEKAQADLSLVAYLRKKLNLSEELKVDADELQRRRDLLKMVTDVEIPDKVIAEIDTKAELIVSAGLTGKEVGTCTEEEILAWQLYILLMLKYQENEPIECDCNNPDRPEEELSNCETLSLGIREYAAVTFTIFPAVVEKIAKRLDIENANMMIVDGWKIIVDETEFEEESSIGTSTHPFFK